MYDCSSSEELGERNKIFDLMHNTRLIVHRGGDEDYSVWFICCDRKSITVDSFFTEFNLLLNGGVSSVTFGDGNVFSDIRALHVERLASCIAYGTGGH